MSSRKEQDRKYYLKNRDKIRTANKAWAEAHPEAMRASVRKYKAKNREEINQKSKLYCLLNKETRKASMKKYRESNKDKGAAQVRRYQASKLLRTPKWLTENDYWMMTEIYELAQSRTKILGYPWHVDHVFPLQGKLVSGLHVPYNLQVIPGIENIKKYNRIPS